MPTVLHCILLSLTICLGILNGGSNTKCHFGIDEHKNWLEVVAEILPGYQNELEAERELWKFLNPWGLGEMMFLYRLASFECT